MNPVDLLVNPGESGESTLTSPEYTTTTASLAGSGEPGESAGQPGESAGEPGESAGELGESGESRLLTQVGLISLLGLTSLQ